MSNGPTSQPNTPGGPGHQSGPPGYPPQGHPGHPGYHPQGYFLTIIIRSKMLNFYFRLPQSPRLSTASWPISTTRYAAIWSTRLFWLSATPRLSSKSSISSISTSISRFILEATFQNVKIYFRLSTRSTRTISPWWSSRSNGRTIKSKSTESIWSASLRWSTGTFEF